MPEWHLYIIRCHDKSLYTGITIDVARRFKEHCGEGKKGAKYLRGKKPFKLIFQTKIGNKSLALKVEKKIKKLPKTEKEILINSDTGIERIITQVKCKGKLSSHQQARLDAIEAKYLEYMDRFYKCPTLSKETKLKGTPQNVHGCQRKFIRKSGIHKFCNEHSIGCQKLKNKKTPKQKEIENIEDRLLNEAMPEKEFINLQTKLEKLKATEV